VVVLLVMRRGGNAPAPSNPPLAAATATAAVPAAISGASTPASSAGQSAAAASATAAVVVTQIPPAATAPATPAATLSPVGAGTEQGSSAGAAKSVVVIERFGAALRLTPSSTAAVYVVAACGEQLPVVAIGNGWYQVHTPTGDLWVGGARVADAANPPAYDCSGAVTFQTNDQVVTSVPSGCLSLRETPATDAPYVYCVDNGHRYVIVNGPIAADGEDWFQVTSASTGSGWVIARYLLPAQ